MDPAFAGRALIADLNKLLDAVSIAPLLINFMRAAQMGERSKFTLQTEALQANSGLCKGQMVLFILLFD